MSGKGLSKEDTKTEHPFQAIVLCDPWGEEQRWGPLVRRARTEDEEYDDLDVGGEQRPFVRLWSRLGCTFLKPPYKREKGTACS